MSADKYPSIFLHQMEAIVYLIIINNIVIVIVIIVFLLFFSGILASSGNNLSVCIGRLRTRWHSEFANIPLNTLDKHQKIQREIPLEPHFALVRSTDFDF